ncbi:MAG: hypothetical protein PHW46_04065, partial [Candidatus Omnitrophica bacterium]|nr:hypothetical protein [Candidatus Omnitrophota bacterium]
HAVNTPGTGEFDVESLSDEFIERHAVIQFRPLPPAGMMNYLVAMGADKTTRVNPKLIGNVRRDTAGNPVMQNGEEKWDGLIGVVQYLANKKKANPLDKNLPPRVPGMRTLKNLVKNIYSYWDTDAALTNDKLQELLFDKFLQNFVMHAEAGKRAKWALVIRDAFKDAGLWTDDTAKDALLEYLAGEDVIVMKLPLLKKPDTKEYNFDQILVYLQENTRGSAVDGKIEELSRLVEELKKDWEKLPFSEELKKMHIMREVWQILNLIRIHRKGTGYDCHSDTNLDKMEQIQESIQAHVLKYDWPPSFIEKEQSYEDLIKSYEKGAFAQSHPSDERIYILVEKLIVNIEDMEYAESISKKVIGKIEELKLDEPMLHKIGRELRSLISTYECVGRLSSDVFPENAQLKELKNRIGEIADKSPLRSADIESIYNEIKSGEDEIVLGDLVKKNDAVKEKKRSLRIVCNDIITMKNKDEILRYLETVNYPLRSVYNGVIAMLIRMEGQDEGDVIHGFENAGIVYDYWRAKVKLREGRGEVPLKAEKPVVAPKPDPAGGSGGNISKEIFTLDEITNEILKKVISPDTKGSVFARSAGILQDLMELNEDIITKELIDMLERRMSEVFDPDDDPAEVKVAAINAAQKAVKIETHLSLGLSGALHPCLIDQDDRVVDAAYEAARENISENSFVYEIDLTKSFENIIDAGEVEDQIWTLIRIESSYRANKGKIIGEKELEKIIRMTRSEDDNLRKSAIRTIVELIKIGSIEEAAKKGIIKTALENSGAGDMKKWISALEMVAEFVKIDPSCVPPTVADVFSSIIRNKKVDSTVRGKAAKAFKEMIKAKNISHKSIDLDLIKALSDDFIKDPTDNERRVNAIEAVVEAAKYDHSILTDSVVKAFICATGDLYAPVREFAAEGIVEVDNKSTPAEINKIMAELIQRLQSANENWRLGALIAIRKLIIKNIRNFIKTEGLLEGLIQKTVSGHSKIKQIASEIAVEIIEKTKSQDEIDRIIKENVNNLDSPDYLVRSGAITVLAAFLPAHPELLTNAVKENIMRSLSSNEDLIEDAAVFFLGKIVEGKINKKEIVSEGAAAIKRDILPGGGMDGSCSAQELLAKIDAEIKAARSEAEKKSKTLKGKNNIKTLFDTFVKQLGLKKANIRERAIQMVGELTEAQPDLATQEVLNRLTTLLDEKVSPLVESSARSIGKIIKVRPDLDARAALDNIKERLKKGIIGDNNARAAGAQMIGDIVEAVPAVDAKAILDELINTMKDPAKGFWRIRDGLIQAIGKVVKARPETADQAILDMLGEEAGSKGPTEITGSAARAIGEVIEAKPALNAQKALAVLIDLLAYGNERIHENAAQSIGKIVKAQPALDIKTIFDRMVADLDEDPPRPGVIQAIGEIVEARPLFDFDIWEVCAKLLTSRLLTLQEGEKTAQAIFKIMKVKAKIMKGDATLESRLSAIEKEIINQIMSQDPGGNTREAQAGLLQALGEIVKTKTEPDAQALLDSLGEKLCDKSWEVSENATAAIGEVVKAQPNLNAETIWNKLLAQLTTRQEWMVRAASARAIGIIIEAKPDLASQNVLDILAEKLDAGKLKVPVENNVYIEIAKAISKLIEARPGLDTRSVKEKMDKMFKSRDNSEGRMVFARVMIQIIKSNEQKTDDVGRIIRLRRLEARRETLHELATIEKEIGAVEEQITKSEERQKTSGKKERRLVYNDDGTALNKDFGKNKNGVIQQDDGAFSNPGGIAI